MSLTRQHFEALAAALRATCPDGPYGIGGERPQWIADVKAVADVCAALNPDFKRWKFYAACGYEEQ